MSKPVDLCQYDLPSGKLCRQIALKGEHVCRHHMRLFRHNQAEMMHQEAMERLKDKLAALEFPDLLLVLYRKLARLQSAVRTDSEARLTLNVTLARLQLGLEAAGKSLKTSQIQ